MPKPDDVVAGEPVEASWGNQDIRDHTVMVMENAGDIALAWPTGAPPGTVVYNLETNSLQVSLNTGWENIAIADLVLHLSGGTMTGTLTVASGGVDVTGGANFRSNVYVDPISDSANVPNVYIAGDGRLYKALLTSDGRYLLLTGGTLTGPLETVAVNVAGTLTTQNAIPDGTGTYDLGSSTNRYRRVYLDEIRGTYLLSIQGQTILYEPTEVQGLLEAKGGLHAVLPTTSEQPNMYVNPADGEVRYNPSPTTLADLEARVAALEA